MAELLAEELLNEIHFKSGAEFESSSLFGDLLGVTMVIDKLHAQLLGDKKYGCFLELRNYPNVSSGDIISCHVSVCVTIVPTLTPSLCRVSYKMPWLEYTPPCTLHYSRC